MEMQFDKNKNLQKDLSFGCTEFKKLFGYNKEREKKIDNLFTVADKLKKIGCGTMFVFDSFAAQREHPNDIDVCFDISNLDLKILEKNSSLFDNYERKRFYEHLKVHLPFFKIKEDDKQLMKFMKKDKDGNERGIIKVTLNDLAFYDKE
jgi:hypothetical protein